MIKKALKAIGQWIKGQFGMPDYPGLAIQPRWEKEDAAKQIMTGVLIALLAAGIFLFLVLI